ncbi:MAG TPA: glycerol-3-phosphate 1-O-acyltransferase PlsY [Bryobacteraceae bacterium]
MTSTPPFLALAVATIVAYLIGGLPFGYWFVRLAYGKDIRRMGSGNIGATNVHRSAGGKAGLIVLLLDICKGLLAVWLADLTTHGDPLGLALAAAAVMLGHCYPIFLNFRGGKAVACFIGAFVYIAPLALLASIVVFILVLAVRRYVSLASIVAVLVFPIAVWFLEQPAASIFAASIFAALLVVYRHRANIARLRSGAEHVFSLKGGKAA